MAQDENTGFGLIIDWAFHRRGGWVSVFAPHLVEAFLTSFRPRIISSQEEYDRHKSTVRWILSMEPGWAAPRIKYDRALRQTVAVMASDPHNKCDWFQEYVLENDIRYVLSQYRRPFFYHFPGFPPERFVHFPWAVPDAFLHRSPLQVRSGQVAIFGARAGDAYDVRNLCREHPRVSCFEYSGVENKAMSDRGYFDWLQRFDAIVAAGSSNPIYDLVTPKYFEIAAAGALLIGQRCGDLGALGFNDDNAMLFDKEEFPEKVEAYHRNPQAWLPTRERGRELIACRHLVSHRIGLLRELLGET